MRVFFIVLAFLFPSSVFPLDIKTEVHDLRPFFPLSLSITMSGSIESGDADRLRVILAQQADPELREISLELDSPGGSLVEGLEIAKILGTRREIVSASVGSLERPYAECASACVLVYLSADLRYLSQSGRIGVHQFADPSGTVGGAVGLDVAQRVSSEIVSLLDRQGVSTELFDQMSNTPPHQITWLSEEDMKRWRVVTGPVFEEWMEYKNLNGKVALYMFHRSLYGTNEMTLFCDGGLVAYAVLDEPEVAMVGGFYLVIDGKDIPVSDVELLNRENRRTRVVMRVPQGAVFDLKNASTIGARVHTLGGDMFWGFEQNVRDTRVRELAESCVGSAAALPDQMRVLSDTDLVGNDLTQTGVRGISFDDCKQVCLASHTCGAVSYVIEKNWCWPKSAAGDRKAAPGTLSAVK